MSEALIKMCGCLAPVASGQSEGVLKKTSEAQRKPADASRRLLVGNLKAH